jgi:dihydroaeruginoic acid synthetase
MSEIDTCLAEETDQQRVADNLSEAQRLVRERVNSTAVAVNPKLIHQDFFIKAREHPGRTALFWNEAGIDRTMTYGELADRALRLAALLRDKGVRPDDAVAVTLPRGPDQVVAVLAVLAAGAAYVPVGVNQPERRRDRMLRIGKIRHLVTDRTVSSVSSVLADTMDITVIAIAEAGEAAPLPQPITVDANSLAYVIFTSGSTGEPKGVEITHASAYNTILDINTRFGVNQSDRILAVSAFDFDLSVYDLFGPLSAGGGVVLLSESDRREAPAWLDLIKRMKVTVWNSVPALLEMLLIASGVAARLPTLRLVLVSGDWVGLDLYDRLRQKAENCRLIALGGATEASIWSNYYEVKLVDPAWSSIPYGTPLSNQCFRVVDQSGRDCPDLVTGELWIGGQGVARGYRGNPESTAASFIDIGAKRWYRTGDLGYYRPDGVLVFCGRSDQQVKLRGYRIELGEIEAVLRQYPGVGQATATVFSQAGSRQLVAVAVADYIAGGIKNFSAAPQNWASGSCQASFSEIQAQIVETLLAEVLNLAKLPKGGLKNRDSLPELRIIDANQPLLQLWLSWLGRRGVITVTDCGLRPGPRIHEVLEYTEVLKRGRDPNNEIIAADPLIYRVGHRLWRRREDYRAILSGRSAAAVLLDDDLLAPESLSAKDSGIISGIGLIAKKLKQMSKTAGKPLAVALLGGRSGLIATKLLELLDPGDLTLTLLDAAPSMVETAKTRLAGLAHSFSCAVMPTDRVPDRFRYCFDVVLALNTLHRYGDPAQGIAVALLLLRRGGKILILEQRGLAPLALVTAAVLERGFADLDHSRRLAGNPMLPARQWAKLLRKAGFNNVKLIAMADSGTEYISAVCPRTRPELDPESIRQFAAAHLPAHMVPEKIAILPWLPLSGNAKVDRQAVAATFESGNEANTGAEPEEGMEREVALMWGRLLQSGPLGRTRSFFKSGGDSLLATRFLAEVKERFGVELSLRELFEAPVLFQVAATLESKAAVIKQATPMEEGEI